MLCTNLVQKFCPQAGYSAQIVQILFQIHSHVSFQKVKQSIKLNLCNFQKSQAVIFFNTINQMPD